MQLQKQKTNKEIKISSAHMWGCSQMWVNYCSCEAHIPTLFRPIIRSPIIAHPTRNPEIRRPLSLSLSLTHTHTHTSNLYLNPAAATHMWNQLPFDLLAYIFSFLSPDSLARAISACKHWHTCAKMRSIPWGPPHHHHHHQPWFVAIIHARGRRALCYAHNPTLNHWHSLCLPIFPHPIRPIAPIGGGLLLCKATSLHLALCNPFTKHYTLLPPLKAPRVNPAVGVLLINSNASSSSSFQVYVAGGMSEGTASYETTLEMYDSKVDEWCNLGHVPMEFAVRLTVWTPNESVYSDGILYWMTSARAYSVMGLEVGTHSWKEVKVPMAEQLECASLVPRGGRVAVVGGLCGGGAYVWELGVGDVWVLLDVVPPLLERMFVGSKGSWGNTKCVGSDEAVYLYRDLGCGMLVWKEVSSKGRWEWLWVEGCYQIRGEMVPKFPLKGMLLHPTLAHSIMLDI
ncbi:protein UNUSUAL FLORAL ORGANS-like [Tasmannia lanceolata]|uniref:protein UNUSUAL FLORAL ORGANS-like n=1 Tax=Tasmannia lanceolata TaxID=3420 RepID=UPI004064849E